MKKILFLLLLLASNVYATSDQSTWISTTYQTDFNKSKVVAFLELQPRFNDDTSKFSQLIIRPLLSYKITDHSTLGVGYTWQGEYNSQDKFDNATNDIVQQYQYVRDIDDSINFQYRARLEERFFYTDDTGYRTRHRIRLTYSIPKTKAYLISSDEIFFYLNSLNDSKMSSSVQSGYNQNRLYAGVGYNILKNLNVDTGYQWQNVNYHGKDDFNNNIWMTNINFRF